MPDFRLVNGGNGANSRAGVAADAIAADAAKLAYLAGAADGASTACHGGIGGKSDSRGGAARRLRRKQKTRNCRSRNLSDQWNEYYAQRATSEPWTADAQARRQHFFDSQTKPPTLQQHLLDQVSGSDMTARQRGIALVIIGNIDDQGYLRATAAEIASPGGLSRGRGGEGDRDRAGL